jgi:uncharacterized protein YjbJ (UPF0337 family)
LAGSQVHISLGIWALKGGILQQCSVSHPGVPAVSVRRRPFTGVRYEEQVMSMNKDQVKGRVKEAEGKIKEVAGKLVGNEKLEEKGKVQKVLGKARAKFGDVKKDMKDATKKRA